MATYEDLAEEAAGEVNRHLRLAEDFAQEANDSRLDLVERQVYATLSAANATMALVYQEQVRLGMGR